MMKYLNDDHDAMSMLWTMQKPFGDLLADRLTHVVDIRTFI